MYVCMDIEGMRSIHDLLIKEIVGNIASTA